MPLSKSVRLRAQQRRFPAYLEDKMTSRLVRTFVRALALTCGIGAMPGLIEAAHAQDRIKIGFVFFLSGPGAAYGVPSRDGAKLVIDALNAGKVPTPYDKIGINGIQIEPVYVDEAGGAQKQLTEYRRLVESEQVDVIIGYNSSADCNAIAPVAEELQALTAFFHCGNPQLFEEIDTKPEYVVRMSPHGTMDQVGAARYLIEKLPKVASIAGINQNYAWGQDNWAEFKAAMAVLKPDVQFINEKFPALGAGEYGAEISSLMTTPADVVFTTFWGGDQDALVLQARNRGLADKSKFLLTLGAETVDDLGEQAIVGSIMGARGPHGYFAKSTPLSDWFATEYKKAYGKVPALGSYAAAQSILGIKAAYEKAAAGKPDRVKADGIVAALRGLTFETPNGYPITMSLANGHQGIQATAYGIYGGWDKAKNAAIVSDIRVYPAECVNPPDGIRAIDWIKSGFKGAACGP
jgi:branched-chain amino acid transport system substrate-binding protein